MSEGERLTSEIRGKLSRLRRRLRRRLAGEGLAWLALALVALVFGTLGIDYLLRLDRLPRVVVMAGALAGAAWVAWKRLMAPLAVPMEQSDLALLVERRYGGLQDRLISAIQFAPGASPVGASEAMMALVARQANEMAEPLDFGRITDRRRLWRAVRPAACAVGILAAFAVWQTDVMRLWAARNLAFADVPWPQKTYLVVAGGPDFAVLRGDDLTLSVSVAPGSETPPSVTLHTRYPSGRAEEEIKPVLGPDGAPVYAKTFQAVAEPFEFYVTGGDDRRDRDRPHQVTLIDPPAWRDVRFTLEYPIYTQRPPHPLDGSGGVIGVPVGGRVSVFARPNKDLQSARILLGEGDSASVSEMRSAPDGGEASDSGGPAPWAGRFNVAGENHARAIPLCFVLKDAQGHENRRGTHFVVQVQPDQAPSLELRKQGVGAVITPQAILPLMIRAKDDYGVGAIRVQAGTAAKPSLFTESVRNLPSGQQEVQTRHDLDIRPRGIQPGEVVRVHVEADDSLPAEFQGPNTGSSGVLEFRVVRPEDLMAELVQRQKALRLEFVQVIAFQETARAKTASAADALQAGQDSPEIRRQLSESAGIQSNVAAECARATETLRAILEEMVNNRLGAAEDHKQLREGIIQPLAELDEPIRRLVATMNGTGRIADPAELRDQAVTIAGVQGDLRARMQAILERMQKLESRQELANQLRVIIKWSESALEGIQKKRDAEVGGVFEPTTKPDTKKD